MIVQIEEDPETGELLIPLPDEILTHMNVVIGDVLSWRVKDGIIILSKFEQGGFDE
jgi:hypothetical protein